MKHIIAMFAICVAVSSAHAKERHYVVKMKSIDKTISYRFMKSKELKALEKELRTEEKYFLKAKSRARDNWKKDEATKNKSFSASGFSARTCKKIGTYKSEADAMKRVIKLTEDDWFKEKEIDKEIEEEECTIMEEMDEREQAKYRQKKTEAKMLRNQLKSALECAIQELMRADLEKAAVAKEKE